MPFIAVLFSLLIVQAVRATTIDNALAALGGREKLMSIPLIVATATGVEHRSAEMQGFAPDSETTAPHEMTLVLYPAAEKTRIDD